MNSPLYKILLLLIGISLHQRGLAQMADKYPGEMAAKIRTTPHDSVMVSISYLKPPHFVDPAVRIIKTISEYLIIAKVKSADIPLISSPEHILFINELHKPLEELATGAFDLSLNKINLVHRQFTQTRAENLRVSVKERLFDTLDIDLLSRVFRTGQEHDFITPHASVMATIIAGAANSAPIAQGVAPGAGITSSSFQFLFPEPDSIFTLNHISVQNHSYGTVLESFYGNEAAAYDQQVYNLPKLLHVFSAGNAGQEIPSSGSYAGLPAVANLTGNFKQAKNIITVGSVDSSGQIMPLSSRGPAYDGRIRPELLAYGEDGSSGAAALVSGTALLLQDVYKDLHGELPEASLVKAALVNSARDVLSPHPDYLSGFGSLDAYRAVLTFLQQRFRQGVLFPGQSVSYDIHVPQGIRQLKLTLAWTDAPAIPNAPKALVNDLDLELELASQNQKWQPWVLDPSPDLQSVFSPAQRKKDTLNNIEQITISNVSEGLYTIHVKASVLATPSQAFSLTWQLDSVSSAYWTFPAKDETMEAGNTHWLRWETGRQGPATVYYSGNDDVWHEAGSIADMNLKYFKWEVPDTLAVFRLKLQQNNEAFISDSFVVSPRLQMEVGYNCTDSFLLYWKNIHAQAYEMYHLQPAGLEPLIWVNDTLVVLDPAQYPSAYYSIAPVVDGRKGLRSNTLHYQSQAPYCYINSFYLQAQTGTKVIFTASLGTLYGVQGAILEKFIAGSFQPVQHIISIPALIFTIEDSSLVSGENHYRLRLILNNGAGVNSDVETVYHWSLSPVLIYPNPALPGQDMKVLANESGRYHFQLFDINGRKLFEQILNSTLTHIRPGLSSGIYLVHIVDREGKGFSLKLMVR